MYHGERFNAWSHLAGAVAAFVGAVWMLVVASLDGSPWKIVSVAIYGFTLLVLY
ncbi:hemolysin III family protein, partial [Pseudomonas edaphica]